MGIGSARGEGRAVQAAAKAISSPLLEASMDGAHGVLLSIAGGSDLGLFEINEAASLVQEAAHEEANIIFGTVIDDSLGDEVRVTVIAAGFDSTPQIIAPNRRPATVVEGSVGDYRAPQQVSAAKLPEPVQHNGYAPHQPAQQPVQHPQYVPATAAVAPPSAPVGGGYGQPSRPSRPIEDDDVDVPPFMKR
jgi:cell division protein FtsZ